MEKGLSRGFIRPGKGSNKGSRSGSFKGLHNPEANRYWNYDLFLAVGDSTMAGAATSGGNQSIPKLGLSFEWLDGVLYNTVGYHRSKLYTDWPHTEISPMMQFCIDWNYRTGRIAVVCNRAVGGATIYPQGNTNNWNSAGINYAPSISDAKAMCSYFGKQLTGILVMCGINDCRLGSGVTIGNISTGLDSFVTALHTDFPRVPIKWSQIGRLDLVPGGYPSLNAGVAGVRNLIKNKAIADPLFDIGSTYTAYEAAGLLSSDKIHAGRDGTAVNGTMFCRSFTHQNYSKWARYIISCTYTEMTTSQKQAVNTFILENETEYLNLDALFIYKANSRIDTFFDWAANCGPSADNLFDFNLNANIATSTTSKYSRTGYNLSLSRFKGPVTDCMFMQKIGTNSSSNIPDNSLCGAYGSGSNFTAMRNNGALTTYLGSTSGISSAESVWANNSEYAVTRIGTNLRWYKNQVLVTGPTSITNATQPSREMPIGVNDQNGTILEPVVCQHKLWAAGKASALALGPALDTLLANY